MHQVFKFSILTAIGAGKTKKIITSQIVNGDDADLGQFPWQAIIDIDAKYLCGGSLILENWILTASHCTEDGQFF